MMKKSNFGLSPSLHMLYCLYIHVTHLTSYRHNVSLALIFLVEVNGKPTAPATCYFSWINDNKGIKFTNMWDGYFLL